MGSQYIPPPEQNVVNVGDEISINALNGIAQANPAITSTNPVATNNSVATAVSGKADAVHTHVIGDVTSLQTVLDGKANLSGATFTGNVTTTGRMGIGGPVPVNANNKLGIYDGNIVFGAGWGLAFGDGTSITSANHSHSISDVTSLQTTLDGKANLSGASFTDNVSIAYTSGVKSFRVNGINSTYGEITPGTLRIGYGPDPSESRTTITNDQFYTGSSLVGTISIECSSSGGFSPYIAITPAFGSGIFPTQIKDGKFEINRNDGNGYVEPYVSSTALSLYATNDSLLAYAQKSGATFTGKIIGTATASTAAINVGTVTATPTSPVNGDIWIGTTLNFRSSDGANRSVPVLNSGNVFSATTSTIPIIQTIQGATSSQPSIEARHLGSGPAILISQRGTGDCIRIEDENPDTTPFVINSAGKVGIGVAPDATAALKVDVNGIMFSDGTTQTTSARQYVRQWARFDGSSSTPSVIAGNVTTVDKLGTGSYRVNFSTAFSNTTYGVQITGKRSGLSEPVVGFVSARSTNNCTIQVGVGSFSAADSDDLTVTFTSGNT